MRKLRILAILVLAVMIVGVCAACVPAKPTNAVANLQKASYSVFQATEGKEFSAEADKYKGMVDYVYAVKDSDYVTVWYFDSVKNAKTNYEKIKVDYVGYIENENVKSGVDGKAVYVGTKTAVKKIK